MALVAILLAPALGAALTLLPVGRRGAALATLAAGAVVLALSLRLAGQSLADPAPTALGGLLSADALSTLILLLVAFIGFAAALFSAGYIGAREAHGDARKGRRYYTLFNLLLLSILAVPLLADIAVMWIAVVMTTMFSAFLVAFEDTPAALEAAWKYVVLTTLGAVLALLGILILYWGTRVAGDASLTWNGLLVAAPGMPRPLLWTGFLLVLVGFGTKAGLVPLHTWMPDAYSQAPAPICALLSGIETTTVLYAILRLFPVLEAAGIAEARSWFIAVGLISVAVAALLLIHVRDYKRMFAFSTVEHMGIVLVAVGLGGADAHFGAVFQIVAHALAKSFSFFAAGAVLLAVGTQEIDAVRGLIRTSPVAATALFVAGLAIAGAPPFAVFLSEFAILKAGLAQGQYVVVGGLAFFVVVAFCAIMYHVNRMIFGLSAASTAAGIAPAACLAALVVAAVPVLVLGVYVPSGLEGLLDAAAAILGGGT